jgi:hypothetical protein
MKRAGKMNAGGMGIMSKPVTVPLSELYEMDETAWLEQMSALVAQRRFKRMDHEHLSEYLSDMARRDKREVRSRLVILMKHLLEWKFQLKKRTNSWQNTIRDQRGELAFDFKSSSLLRHAEQVLAEAYLNAVERAASETGLAKTKFPTELPWTLDEIMNQELGA